MYLNPEFLAGLQTHPARVGVSDQQVAVAMDTRAEISLTTTTGDSTGLGGQAVPPGFHKGAIEALLENATARPYIATGPGNLIFRTIAQGAGTIKERLALQHLATGGFIHEQDQAAPDRDVGPIVPIESGGPQGPG